MNTPETTHLPLGHGRIELVRGNIVEQEANAIVNAANTKLAGGGGVDGAIHRAAGQALARECPRLPADGRGRRCPTGEVRVTRAGKLAAQHVIHAVGPFYNPRYAEKGERQLRQVYENALRAAAEHGCLVIAVPAISTGAYRFPLKRGAQIALETVAEWLKEQRRPEVVRFVLLKEKVFEAFRSALKRLATNEGRAK